MPLSKTEKLKITRAVRAWIDGIGCNPVAAKVWSDRMPDSRHCVDVHGMRPKLYLGEFASRKLADAFADKVNRFISTIK